MEERRNFKKNTFQYDRDSATVEGAACWPIDFAAVGRAPMYHGQGRTANGELLLFFRPDGPLHKGCSRRSRSTPPAASCK